MRYRKKFAVEPGARIDLGSIDPAFTPKHLSKDGAAAEMEHDSARLSDLQYLLYADNRHSVLIV